MATQINSDIMKGKWHQWKGRVKEKWGELTDDQLTRVDGQHEILVGEIQETYGVTKEEAKSQVNDWLSSQQDDDGGK